MKQLSSLLAILSMVGIVNLSIAAPAANIQQLDWMTGNWAGNLGPNQLEELIASEGSTPIRAVRMTGADATSMFEMITIEEFEGSLVPYIQQWDPGFTPRTETAQRLELAEITENSVKFEDVSALRRLL